MTARRLRVALFMGGRSAEHEVSLNSGRMVARYLDNTRYEVLPLEIGTDGAWLLDSPTLREIRDAGQASADPGLIRSFSPATALPDPALIHAVSPATAPSDHKIDVVFLALHGPFGEDGTIQGMLDLVGVPYTCSGVLASALAMDKFRMKAFARGLGIRVPADRLISKTDFAQNRGAVISGIAALGGTIVIKPNRLGSSVATFIIEDPADVELALSAVFELGQDAIAETFIPGTEITAPVLGNAQPEALPVIEIIPNKGRFYDYQSKYAEGGSDHIIPARISPQLTASVQSQAVTIHAQLGCRGVTRSDFILAGEEAYFLEINTIPGMTATSLVPQAAEVAGYSFSRLLDRLIELALE